jgi:biofilm PGA synthesis N-glycosyltransferase PgaC
MDILDLILISAMTATFLLYVAYLLILKVLISLRHASTQTLENVDWLPRLSVIVPTYNEATVIRAKLESLDNVSYPKEKCEIIVVDSGSTDSTCQIIEEYKSRELILLKQEKRMGKANAINFALQKASGDIIVLTDANAEFDPDAINTLVRKFDQNTGAVLPRLVPCGKLSYWDEAFHDIHNIYKSLESRTDSVFIVFGELFAFRRGLVDQIDENAAADDLQIAMAIRKKNYKIKYSPDVTVKERVPSSQKEVRTQKARRIFGIVQAMKKNFDFFLNPSYGAYGLLIFPTHFLQLTLGPFLIFSCLFLLIQKLGIMILGNPQPLIGAAVLALSLLLLSILCFLLSLVRKIASFVYNLLATQVYVIIALVNFARGKEYSVWEKIASTREVGNA